MNQPQPQPATLGYVVPEWPGQTHAFFWREYSAMLQQGAVGHLVSTRRPKTDKARHGFAADAESKTRYIFPPSLMSLFSLIKRPVGTLRSLGYINSLQGTSLKQKASMVGMLLCAADLVSYSRKQSINHLHIHSCSNAAHLGALARLLGGPTYGLTLHGDLEVYGQHHKQKMGHAAYVSTVTRALQTQVTENVGLNPDIVPVIWMGVDTDKFTPAELKPRAEQCEAPDGLANHPLHIVTVARLNLCKGHEFALAAMRQAIDAGAAVRYTIAGEGPAEEEIKAKIAELNLADHVDMPGNISEDAVLELVRSCDAFILPSIGMGEAAPVSVMEALACGKPVISSIIGGTPDMITDGHEGYLVEQRDVDGLCKAIAELANDPALRNRMGEAARQTAIEKFDYRALAGRLLEWITWANNGASADQRPETMASSPATEQEQTPPQPVLAGQEERA